MTIKSKLLCLLGLFILTTLFIVSFMSYRSYQDSIGLAKTNAKALTYSAFQYAATFMETAGSYTSLLAHLPQALEAEGKLPTYLHSTTAQRIEKNTFSPQAQALFNVLEQAQKTESRITEIGFSDIHGGTVLAPAVELPAHFDPRQRPWYTKAMNSPSGTAMSIMKSVTGSVVCSFSQVVKNNGKPIGVLYVEITLDTLSDVLAKLATGKTDRIALLNEEGFIVASESRETLLTKPSEHPNLPIMKTSQLPSGEHIIDFAEKEWLAVVYISAKGWKYIYRVETDEVLEGTHYMLIVCSVSSFLALALVVFIGLYIAKSINTPLKTLQNTASTIAKGDIDTPLPEEKNFTGELHDLFINFSHMVQAIRATLQQARESESMAKEESSRANSAMQKAELAAQESTTKTQTMQRMAEHLAQVAANLGEASRELSSRVQQSDSNAEEAARQLSSVATAMNEMNATVREVAINASTAANATSETREKASNGANVVLQSEKRITSVRTVSEQLLSDMSQLHEHASSITSIMNVISDIADQTNLLALNAAIEAARAGEAGRGFAVVADEVRKLAEKTMLSTQDVSRVTSAIQESTNKSMNSVKSAVHEIELTTDLAHESEHALEEIVANVGDMASQVDAIATASEEQSAASEEINVALERVSTMVSQTASDMGEASEAIKSLAEQASTLSKLVEEMRQA